MRSKERMLTDFQFKEKKRERVCWKEETEETKHREHLKRVMK